MKLTIDVKWYHFSQNNSGGHWEIDANVAPDIFIQAASAKEAINKATEFCDNSNSCECCGDRWYLYGGVEGFEVPTSYGKPYVEQEAGYGRTEARAHHYDGRIETLVPKVIAQKP